jgi:hypothetical protein
MSTPKSHFTYLFLELKVGWAEIGRRNISQNLFYFFIRTCQFYRSAHHCFVFLPEPELQENIGVRVSVFFLSFLSRDESESGEA